MFCSVVIKEAESSVGESKYDSRQQVSQSQAADPCSSATAASQSNVWVPIILSSPLPTGCQNFFHHSPRQALIYITLHIKTKLMPPPTPPSIFSLLSEFRHHPLKHTRIKIALEGDKQSPCLITILFLPFHSNTAPQCIAIIFKENYLLRLLEYNFTDQAFDDLCKNCSQG